jgi:hypothetical protein
MKFSAADIEQHFMPSLMKRNTAERLPSTIAIHYAINAALAQCVCQGQPCRGNALFWECRFSYNR